MKTRLKFNFPILALLMLFVLPAAMQAQFTFTTNNGAITITGYTGSGGAVVIPPSTNGYPVTSIGDYAFSHSGVTSVTIGTNITSIGIEAFDDCTGLTSITIPNNVTSIGDGAFAACFSLTSTTIPSSVTNLGAAPFDACPMAVINVAAGNPAFTSIGGVLFNQGQTKLIEFPGGSSATSYTIPIGVTDIALSAFQNCYGLTNIVISDSVTNIEASAFLNCNGLTSITIPNSVTSIGSSGGGAFEYCTSLTQVYFLGNAPSAGSYVFEFDNNLTAVYYLPGTTGWGATFSGIPAIELVNYTITVSASPSVGGSVSGGGSFAEGSSQTVTASANSGYTFANWTESGIAVSPSTNYAFTLTGNVNLVANFTANPANHTITVSTSPGAGGTVSGGGTFVSGTSQTVTATTSDGYTFVNWTENGVVVSSSASYSFTLNGNRNLVANFVSTPFVMYVPGAAGSIMKITSAGVVSTLISYFGSPSGMALDTNGNLYLAAGSVYKVTPNGNLSTLASFEEATGVAFDPSGNLYVADFGNGTISKITPAGVVSLFASGFTSDPDLGGNGNLSVACDGNGNVFLADYDAGTVSKITPAGVKSVFADGMSYLFSITTDPGGNVYVADFYGTVTKFTPAGAVSTLATASWYATGLAFDSGGNLYVSHVGNNAIAEVTSAGVVSTFVSGYSGPIAIFSGSNPPTITTQPQNQGLITGQAVPAVFSAAADGQNIGYQWNVSTNGGATWTPLANGATYTGATSATLTVANATGAFSGYEYECVATNGLGSAISSPAVLTNVPFLLYVADEINNTVSTFTPDGHVTLLSGGLNHPLAIASDTAGNIYVANQGDDTVSKISTAGVVSTFASGVYQPDGLAFDGSGNLYVADSISGAISKVTPAGVVSTFASGFSQPSGLAFDGAGNLYVANSGNNTVSEITPAGGVSTFASGFGYPTGLAFDGGGNLYVANWTSNTVSKVTPAGMVSTFASGFNGPMGLAFDGSGNLYVANYANSTVSGTISKVTPAGVVTTFFGNLSDLVAISAVTAPAAPTITIQPQSVTLPAGENAVFSIDVSGAPGSNTFQWQVSTDGGATWLPLSNNTIYSGVTSPTLTVTGAISGYEFECVVMNAYGSATSNPAILTHLPFLMYVANASSSTVSAITPAGAASTFASGMSGALAVDNNGNLYLANEGNGTVSKVTPAGLVSTFASGFNEPIALACDTSGNLFVANEGSGTISKVTSAGVTSTFASGFGDPTALACDANGNLYVADYDYSTVSKITPAAVVSLYATEVFNPEGLAFDASGNLYEANVVGLITKITPAGVTTTFASGLYDPDGLAFDGSGNLYVINGNGPVSMITPAGVVSTFVSGLGDLTSIAIVTAPAPPTTGNYTITVGASPSAGGTVSGGGTFPAASSSLQTVTAKANSGYMFANWTVNGNVVSFLPAYYFTLNDNISLVANFYKISYQTLDDPSAASTNGYGTFATGVSGNDVVGYYSDINGNTRGFVNSSNVFIILQDPNANDYTVASGISDGNIVGSYANGSSHGFLFSDGTYKTFSYFDGLYGNANANGIDGTNIVGSFPDDSGTHGWLYNGITYTTLDDPNSIPVYNNGYLQTGSYTVANGISGGTIVGSYAVPSFVGLGVSQGFAYSNGNYTTINVPNATGGTSANGIDGGNIVGTFWDGVGTHGFLYSNGNYTTLDAPNGAGSTYALGISGNTIVGYYVTSNGIAHGFIATWPSNVLYTIAVSASPGAGGMVAGGGTFASGSLRMVTATANSGYTFINWTENGTVVSSTTNYALTLNSNVTLVANFTVSPDYYTITVSAFPNAGGTVSGTGAFPSGSSQRVTATANNGYAFANWTENGSVVSSAASYMFTLYSNVTLVANFTVIPVNYTITVSASPSAGGTVSGEGTFALGSSQTVTATANNGYTFANWTENGSVVSLSSDYTFTVNSNMNLVANFTANAPSFEMYVANDGNGTISGVTSNGVVSTFATVGYYLEGMAFDGSGNLYVANDNNGTVYKVTPAAVVSAFATGFSSPQGLAFDGSGNLYVANLGNGTVSRVTTAAVVTTFASGFAEPAGLAFDQNGNLYVANLGSNMVSKVTSAGVVSTFASGFSTPWGLAFDQNGNLYVANNGNNTVLKVTSAGVVSPFASGFDDQAGLAFDANGNLYVANFGNSTVSEVTPTGVVSTFASGLLSPTYIAIVSMPNQSTFTINVSAYPSAGGTVGGGGAFVAGSSQTVTATANSGYTFADWTKNGSVMSSASNYTFTVSSNMNLVGNFTAVTGSPPIITIQPTNNPVVVTAGSNVTFSVTVTGTGPFSYQWQINGTNLPNGIITTVAGNGTAGYSGDGGAATNAEFFLPYGVAVDTAGNLFVADFYNNRVRKVGINGIITTVVGNGFNYYIGDGGAATNAEVNGPAGLAFDRSGNLFIADVGNNVIRKVSTNGIITTVAGNGYGAGTGGADNGGYSGDGGAATNAELNSPNFVALDTAGDLFISDVGNHRVRKVGTNGIISTVAGNGTSGYSSDGGAAINAELSSPIGLALDAAGNLFIADIYNLRIRKVGTNGVITTVAGNGTYPTGYSGDGGAATNAELYDPYGLAMDTTGNLFIGDSENQRIRKVGTNGIITTVAGNGYGAGTGTGGYSGDGGAATNAELNSPEDVAVDTSGNLFIADVENQRIRKVIIQGPTLVLNDVGVNNAGTYDVVVSGPYGSVTSSVVNLTITTPLQITTTLLPNGTNGASYNQTLAASGGQPPYSWTNISGALPPGLALATNGVISGAPTTNGTFNFTVKDTDALPEMATQALALTVIGLPGVMIQPTNNPVAVAVGSNVTVSVTVTGTGPFGYQWQINGTNLPNGIITTVAGNGTNGYSGDGKMATNAELSLPAGVAVDAAANLFIADEGNNRIRKLGTNGIITTVAGGGYNYLGDGGAATNAELWQPTGVAVDATGNLFIADWYNNRIRKVNTNGIITTVAGNGYDAETGSGGYSGDGGAATNAELDNPDGVAVDSIGNVFIVDRNNQRIRKVGTNGIITTVAGNGISGYAGDGGPATNAELYNPVNVAADASGNLFIADSYNYRVRKVGTNGIITTVAGGGYNYPGDGGAATNAGLSDPQGVAVDSIGDLFIADFGNERIRKVDARGIITTVAGNGTNGYSGDGGVATSGEFNDPWGVVVDATGNLLIADWDNQRVRKVVFAGPTLVLTNVSAASAGAYDVVVSSPYGSVTSSVVNVILTVPIVLSTPQLVSNGQFQLTVNGGVTGQTYVLLASTNLVNWIPISGFVNTNPPLIIYDPNAANYRWRFYRIGPASLVPATELGVGIGAGSTQLFSSNGLNLALYSLPGLAYQIEASTDLVNWIVMTNFTSTNSLLYFSDPNAKNYKQRFYRAVLP